MLVCGPCSVRIACVSCAPRPHRGWRCPPPPCIPPYVSPCVYGFRRVHCAAHSLVEVGQFNPSSSTANVSVPMIQWPANGTQPKDGAQPTGREQRPLRHTACMMPVGHIMPFTPPSTLFACHLLCMGVSEPRVQAGPGGCRYRQEPCVLPGLLTKCVRIEALCALPPFSLPRYSCGHPLSGPVAPLCLAITPCSCAHARSLAPLCSHVQHRWRQVSSMPSGRLVLRWLPRCRCVVPWCPPDPAAAPVPPAPARSLLPVTLDVGAEFLEAWSHLRAVPYPATLPCCLPSENRVLAWRHRGG